MPYRGHVYYPPGPRKLPDLDDAEEVFFGVGDDRVSCGYIKLREPIEGALYQMRPGGWDCFSSGKRPLFTAPTREDAIALLTAKFRNREIAKDFHEQFNRD